MESVQVIVRGKTYIQAVQKMQRALYEFDIRGVKVHFIALWMLHRPDLKGLNPKP